MYLAMTYSRRIFGRLRYDPIRTCMIPGFSTITCAETPLKFRVLEQTTLLDQLYRSHLSGHSGSSSLDSRQSQ